MPKQHDLVKATTLDNEASHGSFASLVHDTQDEGMNNISPVRGPIEERGRNDGMTSLHHILGNVNNNISMIPGPLPSPMQGIQQPTWHSPWNEHLPDYHNSSPQVDHILHIINSVFETLDEEPLDDCLIGNPHDTPMAPQ